MIKPHNIRLLLIRLLGKVKTFIMLLLRGVPLFNISNAKETPNIEVLTLDIKNIYDENDSTICLDWNLINPAVEVFFKTAEPFVFSTEINNFDILTCEDSGEIIFYDIKRKYGINRSRPPLPYSFQTSNKVMVVLRMNA